MYVIVIEYPDDDPTVIGPFDREQDALDYIARELNDEVRPMVTIGLTSPN